MQNLFNNVSQCDITTEVVLETDTTIYINTTNIPHYIAKQLAKVSDSSYGGDKETKTISSTMFTQSTKQILLHLERAENPYKLTVDVKDLLASVIGSMFHEKMLVDRDVEDDGLGEPDRQFKELCGFTITGGADYIRQTQVDRTLNSGEFIPKGTLELRDIKTTSTTNITKLNMELSLYDKDMSLADMKAKYPTVFKYISQLSIYNWLYDLNLSVGYLDIFMFNWSPMNLNTIGQRVQEIQIDLKPAVEVEKYLTEVLTKLSKYIDNKFKPNCTDTDLYGTIKTQYKIMKSGAKKKINNSGTHYTYASAQEALSKGNFVGGIIKEFKDKTMPWNCIYCDFHNTEHCEQGIQIHRGL